MYEIETVRVYTEQTVAQELLHQMIDGPAETWVIGPQDFISGLPDPLDPAVIVHKDVATWGPAVVVTGDARVWLDTGLGVLVFRSGLFADEVRASFGIVPPTHQPAATPPQPPVEEPVTPEAVPVDPAPGNSTGASPEGLVFVPSTPTGEPEPGV